jgi:hypothetical protein
VESSLSFSCYDFILQVFLAKIGSYREWKAGDTRADYSAILNPITMLVFVGFFAFCGYIAFQFEKRNELVRMRREVSRESEYKEVCSYSSFFFSLCSISISFYCLLYLLIALREKIHIKIINKTFIFKSIFPYLSFRLEHVFRGCG